MRPGPLRHVLKAGVLMLLPLGLAQSQVQAQTVSSDPAPAAPTAGVIEQTPQAQFEQGLQHHEGAGVARNYARAAEWFALAAAQSHAGAANMLGRYHHAGLGVEQDPAAALHWLQFAARAAPEQPQFLFDLASVLDAGTQDLADPARAATLYERAANMGHLEAAVSLGVLYQNGTGVAQDLDRARALYEAAAAQGHARAQNNLGLLYVRGEGAAQDYEAAAALFAAAAEQGLAVARTNLGVMYENGFGVALDEARAAALYRQGGDKAALSEAPLYDARLAPPDTSAAGLERLNLAVATGDPVARFQKAWLLLSAETVSAQEQIAAARLMRQAAEAGLGSAMVNLGLLYAAGDGVHQDFVLAYMWLLRAALAGQPDAAAHSTALAARMAASQINDAQARLENKQ